METFSLKLCQFLSYLAPGFEGHWDYYKNARGEMVVVCRSEYHLAGAIGGSYGQEICPAWQAEDLLRNLKAIALKQLWTPEKYMQVGTTIALYLYEFPDTAYPKIEEYLWSILK